MKFKVQRANKWWLKIIWRCQRNHVKMQLCGRGRKLWLLAFIPILAGIHLLLIYCDIKILEWEPNRFLFGVRRTPPPSLANTTKKILYWNTMFGDETFYFGHGDIFKNCPNTPPKACYATHDRYTFDITQYDAILFHGNELSARDRPAERDPSQKYIFVNLESPVTFARRQVSYFDNYFNLTMTYRVDSDIQWSYYAVRDRESGDIVAPALNAAWKIFESATGDVEADTHMMDLVKTKKRTAVWFVSNCNSDSAREKYVKELSKYIDVDIYGRCGDGKNCPKGQDCFQKLVEPEYFFYLSFENSLCRDYITEKLSNALEYHVVPVVYGGANYSIAAPPKSYINALDFNTPRELAAYLISLMKSPSKYAEYFRWKRHYEIVSSAHHTICNLCRFLHEGTEHKEYDSILNWYLSGNCPLQEKLKSYPYLTKVATMFTDD